MRHIGSAIALIGITTSSALIGFLVGSDHEYNTGWDVQPTKEERSIGVIVGETIPGSVTIYFESPEKIKRRHPDAYAYSAYNANECEIHYPTGQRIWASMKNEYSAMWENSFNNTALVHELLHCLRGDWHGEP